MSTTASPTAGVASMEATSLDTSPDTSLGTGRAIGHNAGQVRRQSADQVTGQSADQATKTSESAAGFDAPLVATSTRGSRWAARSKEIGASMAWATVGFAVLAAVWALAASRIPELPSPAATFVELKTLLARPLATTKSGPGVGVQLLNSLQRVFIGFSLAAVVGIPLGFAIGRSRRAWQAANPVIQLLRPVSPLAWFPIWLVVFKNAPQAAVWVIFITALWPIVINTAAGASSVPRDQLNVARVFRFGRFASLRHVVVPHSLPSVVTGLRLSMSVAWMVIVAVEMLSGGTGIGFFVWDSYNALNLAGVVAAIVLIGVIGVIGVIFDQLFLWCGRKVAVPEVTP